MSWSWDYSGHKAFLEVWNLRLFLWPFLGKEAWQRLGLMLFVWRGYPSPPSILPMEAADAKDSTMRKKGSLKKYAVHPPNCHLLLYQQHSKPSTFFILQAQTRFSKTSYALSETWWLLYVLFCSSVSSWGCANFRLRKREVISLLKLETHNFQSNISI